MIFKSASNNEMAEFWKLFPKKMNLREIREEITFLGWQKIKEWILFFNRIFYRWMKRALFFEAKIFREGRIFLIFYQSNSQNYHIENEIVSK